MPLQLTPMFPMRTMPVRSGVYLVTLQTFIMGEAVRDLALRYYDASLCKWRCGTRANYIFMGGEKAIFEAVRTALRLGRRPQAEQATLAGTRKAIGWQGIAKKA